MKDEIKQKHKKQLILYIKLYFGYQPYEKKLIRLYELNYRKVKKISKILGVYWKYYDDSLTEADYATWYRL